VGQRRGLGVASPEPRYVVAIDAERAEVVVGSGDEASRAGLSVRDVSWVAGEAPGHPLECVVKVRHRHEGERATVSAGTGGTAEVRLARRVRGVAPGQAAVFYDGDEVLGGGRIV
jgi:tRNA-specific 2-thiouridylase